MPRAQRHFVQYHNPDKPGHAHGLSDDFCILTAKPYGMLAALPGNVVWLIGGEGRPRAYSLCSVFVVDEIGESDEPGFRWYARGSAGRLFRPPLRIDGDPWFGSFLHRNANFSLGLRALDEHDVVQLQRLSGVLRL
jgi:hypothetical protein